LKTEKKKQKNINERMKKNKYVDGVYTRPSGANYVHTQKNTSEEKKTNFYIISSRLDKNNLSGVFFCT